ncbi:MAG: hypothetical protein OXK75_06690 [Gammaproteobacteria bacterium]|nr:hypothetical protein [Gammaproteobacteria bacterium]
MGEEYDRKDLERALRRVFEEGLPRQIERLEELQKMRHELSCEIVSSQTADVYIHEAHYCYLHGNFFATVIMMASAFETCLKSIVYNKTITRLPSSKGREQRIRKIDQEWKNAGFKDLINDALKIKVINDKEKKELDSLRDIRNKLVHNYDPILPTTLNITKTDLRYAKYDEIYEMARQAVQLTPLFNEIQRVRGLRKLVRPKKPYYI